MADNIVSRLIQIIEDRQNEIPERTSALRDLRALNDASTTAALKSLLDRDKPTPEQATKNWDPVAAERVVDLHIVWTLHALGDDTELHRIAALVSQAGDVLVGWDDELYNAASVILGIGRTDVIHQIIELSDSKEAGVAANAVKVLNQLYLPQAPIGGPVGPIPHLSEEVTFEITTLKKEMETIESLSQGSIQLSPKVREHIVANGYERGTVRRENVTLAKVVERDLEILELDYYVDHERVIICTHDEAAQRWQDWWRKYGDQLMYQEEQSRFILKGEG